MNSAGARRTWLVARREWNQRVRTLAFRISTLVTIGVVAALILLAGIYGGASKAERTVGIVGSTSAQMPALLHAVGDRIGLTVKTRTFGDEGGARAALRAGDVAVVLVDDRSLVWKSQPDQQLKAVVTGAVQVVEQQRAIAELGLTADQAQRLLQPPALRAVTLEPATKEQTARADLGRIGVVLLFTAIAFYCGFVLTGVVEEKSSRVVEVLLSRVRPTELLAGKIAGIGLVGLAQFAITVVVGLVALSVTHNDVLPDTTGETLASLVFWFVLGYAFYAVLYATAGSLVSRQEETQTISLPMTAILLAAYVASLAATQSPDGTAALIGSLLPPTAPMVMIVRLAHGAVPWWQIALSILFMVAAVYGLVRLAGRIYAGGVLRIGPRLRLTDAWHGASF
ncbi:MAG: ABC transporter permease [Actinomycetota bacterium]